MVIWIFFLNFHILGSWYQLGSSFNLCSTLYFVLSAFYIIGKLLCFIILQWFDQLKTFKFVCIYCLLPCGFHFSKLVKYSDIVSTSLLALWLFQFSCFTSILHNSRAQVVLKACCWCCNHLQFLFFSLNAIQFLYFILWVLLIYQIFDLLERK